MYEVWPRVGLVLSMKNVTFVVPTFNNQDSNTARIHSYVWKAFQAIPKCNIDINHLIVVPRSVNF